HRQRRLHGKKVRRLWALSLLRHAGTGRGQQQHLHSKWKSKDREAGEHPYCKKRGEAMKVKAKFEIDVIKLFLHDQYDCGPFDQEVIADYLTKKLSESLT